MFQVVTTHTSFLHTFSQTLRRILKKYMQVCVLLLTFCNT